MEPLAQCLPTTLSLVLMWGPSGTSGPMSSERGCALLIVVWLSHSAISKHGRDLAAKSMSLVLFGDARLT